MKLVEALKILRQMERESGPAQTIVLVCGFTPLHLQTFLTAHLRVLDPVHRIAIATGLYGDSLGSLEALRERPPSAVAVVLEWADLDPRLGLRALGGWRPDDLCDILATVRARGERFRQAIDAAAADAPLVLCLPTLPLPPVAHTPGWQASPFELELREILAGFASLVAAAPGVRVVNPHRLDLASQPAERLDVKSELMSGFPYRIAHADAVAASLARLIRPPQPKKGLITDLDDTLWRGLLGEVGVAGITWHLDHHTHAHALYQRMLTALAGAGVLVAVASKNDDVLVAEAFGRTDLVLDAACVFPREVHWRPKSESVGRILRTWNVAPDSVVFVDDSPMELAEVQAAFPEIECLSFPIQDDAAIYDLIVLLRDRFGKGTLTREDTLRLESLRRAAEARTEGPGAPPAPANALLDAARPELRLSFAKGPADPRALELINKTNQFNLNGRRFTEGEWQALLRAPDTFLLRAAYEDKFGPLGTIAVLAGRGRGLAVHIDAWVMSCRAFARQIEHRCLAAVFETLGAEEVVLDYEATARNGPLRDFLQGFAPPAPGPRLSREAFAAKCPPLPHHVKGWTDD
jgi:FkbH-like protein